MGGVSPRRPSSPFWVYGPFVVVSQGEVFTKKEEVYFYKTKSLIIN